MQHRGEPTIGRPLLSPLSAHNRLARMTMHLLLPRSCCRGIVCDALSATKIYAETYVDARRRRISPAKTPLPRDDPPSARKPRRLFAPFFFVESGITCTSREIKEYYTDYCCLSCTTHCAIYRQRGVTRRAVRISAPYSRST